MPKSNVIVAGISKVDLPPPGPLPMDAAAAPLTVHFDNGAAAKLTPANAHLAEIIDELRRMIMPVYVEVDPASQSITRLLIPLVVNVTSVTPNSAGDVDVELEISHSRHVLRAANPNYNEILSELRNAQARGTTVVVTEDENGGIVDVRPSPHPNRPAALGVPRVSPQPLDLAPPSVSPQRAQELFDQMLGQSCDPKSAAAPCIPFLYPDDGCWGARTR
jgi:hypothetical protein